MRAIQTFILRLLVDPADPGALRGAVESVSEGISRPFVGEEQLLALLRSATKLPGEALEPANGAQGSAASPDLPDGRDLARRRTGKRDEAN